MNPVASLNITESGYPILQDAEIWKARQKRDVERFVWTYLSNHYSKPVRRWVQDCLLTFKELASMGCVPLKALMENPSSFVDIKYLPRPNICRGPHNMSKDSLSCWSIPCRLLVMPSQMHHPGIQDPTLMGATYENAEANPNRAELSKHIADSQLLADKG